MELKFYLCKHCGNVVEMVVDRGVPILCCGEKMHLLAPNTTDAAGEKHVPVVTVMGSTVKVSVGSVTHPMEEKHHIAFIALETKHGVQRRELHPDEAPEAVFALAEGDEAVAAYEYCNLHGLWKNEIK